MWFILLFILIAAFADVIGGAITIVKKFNSTQLIIISGLGTGFLLGATLLDRLPDAMSRLPRSAPIYIMLGYLLILFIERLGTPHQHHPIEKAETEKTYDKVHDSLINSKAAFATFIGLLFHTFMDGVILAGSFDISRASGILIFIAITLHKIPEGFSMASVSLAGGYSRIRALFTSSALAASTLVGALLTLSIGSFNISIVSILTALATGTFLYVSTTDMVPSLRNQQISGIISIVIGVVIFYISLLLVQHSGLT